MHGIYFNSDRNLHNTILSPNNYLQYLGCQKDFKFVWSIYNEVAREHNIKLPTAWHLAKIYQKSDRKQLQASMYILEPLDKPFIADGNFDFRNFIVKKSAYNIYTDINWRTRAEGFFMVNQSAKNLLAQNTYSQISPMLGCKKWRIISLKES